MRMGLLQRTRAETDGQNRCYHDSNAIFACLFKLLNLKRHSLSRVSVPLYTWIYVYGSHCESRYWLIFPVYYKQNSLVSNFCKLFYKKHYYCLIKFLKYLSFHNRESNKFVSSVKLLTHKSSFRFQYLTQEHVSIQLDWDTKVPINGPINWNPI